MYTAKRPGQTRALQHLPTRWQWKLTKKHGKVCCSSAPSLRFMKLKVFDVFVVSGDGGNDVSMIQAADCGVGIEGKVMCLQKLHKQHLVCYSGFVPAA